MGKSLFAKDCGAELGKLVASSVTYKRSMAKSVNKNTVVTVPIHGTSVETDDVVDALLLFEETLDAVFPRVYHLDIAPTVYLALSY